MAADGFDLGGALNNFNNIMAQGYRDRLAIQQQGAQDERSLLMEGIKNKQAKEAKQEEYAHQDKLAAQKAQAMKEMYGVKSAGAASKKDLERLTKFNEAMNIDKANGRTPLGKARIQEQKAQQVEALVGGYKNFDEIPPQQIYELARSHDALVSGGTGSISGTEHLVPKSALGDFNSFKNYLQNLPGGAGQGAFVQNILDSVRREKQLAHDNGLHAIKQTAIAYRDIAQKFPQEYSQIIDMSGINKQPQPQGAPPVQNAQMALQKIGAFANMKLQQGVPPAQVDAWRAKQMQQLGIPQQPPQGGTQAPIAPQPMAAPQPGRAPQSFQPVPPAPSPWAQPQVPGGAAQQTLPLPSDMQNYLDSGQ